MGTLIATLIVIIIALMVWARRRIKSIKAELLRMTQDRNQLLNTADKLGLNLRPVIDRDNLWASRCLILFQGAFKQHVRAFTVPDYNQARQIECLEMFIKDLPGGTGTETAIEQYDHTAEQAGQFLNRDCRHPPRP